MQSSAGQCDALIDTHIRLHTHLHAHIHMYLYNTVLKMKHKQTSWLNFPNMSARLGAFLNDRPLIVELMSHSQAIYIIIYKMGCSFDTLLKLPAREASSVPARVEVLCKTINSGQ